jgi:hypothetical protein
MVQITLVKNLLLGSVAVALFLGGTRKAPETLCRIKKSSLPYRLKKALIYLLEEKPSQEEIMLQMIEDYESFSKTTVLLATRASIIDQYIERIRAENLMLLNFLKEDLLMVENLVEEMEKGDEQDLK